MRLPIHSLPRSLRNHIRLFISALVGLLVVGALARFSHLHVVTNLIIGWNVVAWLYIASLGAMMLRSTQTTMRRRALTHDEGPWVMLVIVILAAVASLAAIVVELANVKDLGGATRYAHIGLAVLTIVASWLFTHTSFALHYAHNYYAAIGHHSSVQHAQHGNKQAESPQQEELTGGLIFPGNDAPDYADFLYLAGIIGTSAQTADVSFSSKPMRRMALLHCLLAFAFNTTLLALTINIAASLLT